MVFSAKNQNGFRIYWKKTFPFQLIYGTIIPALAAALQCLQGHAAPRELFGKMKARVHAFKLPTREDNF